MHNNCQIENIYTGFLVVNKCNPSKVEIETVNFNNIEQAKKWFNGKKDIIRENYSNFIDLNKDKTEESLLCFKLCTNNINILLNVQEGGINSVNYLSC